MTKSGNYKKIFNPKIKLKVKKTDNMVEIDFVQLKSVLRMVIFDKDILRDLKKNLKLIRAR